MISDSEALQERKLHSHVLMQGFTSFTVTGQLFSATAVSVNLLAYHAVLLGHSSKRKDTTEEISRRVLAQQQLCHQDLDSTALKHRSLTALQSTAACTCCCVVSVAWLRTAAVYLQ